MRAAKPDNWVAAPASASSVPAGVLAPGVWMSIPVREKFCTLSAGVRSASGDRTGFLTAGHCGDDGMEVRLDGVAGPLLGSISDSDESFDSTIEVLNDSAAVWSTTASSAAATVAGLPVAGVMTRDAARQLKKGTPICFDGATSGVVCSPLDGADIDTMMLDGAAQHTSSVLQVVRMRPGEKDQFGSHVAAARSPAASPAPGVCRAGAVVGTARVEMVSQNRAAGRESWSTGEDQFARSTSGTGMPSCCSSPG